MFSIYLRASFTWYDRYKSNLLQPPPPQCELQIYCKSQHISRMFAKAFTGVHNLDDNQRWGQTAALTVRWLPDVSLIPVTGRRRPDVTSCDMSTLHSSSTASANWSWLDKGSSAPQSFRCLSERSSKVSNHFELISSLHPTPPPLPLFSLAFQYLPLCISFSEHPFMVCCYWRIWFNKEQFS